MTNALAGLSVLIAVSTSAIYQPQITVHTEYIYHDSNKIINEDDIKPLATPKVKVISNRWGISLTKSEINLLAKIVFLESGNQGIKGQEYVCEAIFNRLTSDEFKDDIYSVLSESGQFTTWKNRSKACPTEDTYKAIENVLSGRTNHLSARYCFFWSGGTPKWAKNVYKYKDHYFFTN